MFVIQQKHVKMQAEEFRSKLGEPKLFEERVAVNLSGQNNQCRPELENGFW